MTKFIPIDKMRKLREAARNGDEGAKRILRMQLDGTSDFSSDLDTYFSPKPETDKGLGREPTPEAEKGQSLEGKPQVNAGFHKALPANNGLGQEQSFIDKLIQDEIDAIKAYNDAIMEVMQLEELTDATKEGLIAKLKHIRDEEVEHFNELKRMKGSLDKKDEQPERELTIKPPMSE